MKKYFEPEMELVRFTQADILASSSTTTSANYQPITDENGDGWSNYPTRPRP